MKNIYQYTLIEYNFVYAELFQAFHKPDLVYFNLPVKCNAVDRVRYVKGVVIISHQFAHYSKSTTIGWIKNATAGMRFVYIT